MRLLHHNSEPVRAHRPPLTLRLAEVIGGRPLLAASWLRELLDRMIGEGSGPKLIIAQATLIGSKQADVAPSVSCLPVAFC